VTDFYKSLFLNGFFLILIAGCATTPRIPEAPESFALKGKVAVRENGENFSANILWHQVGDGFEIDLWGPLGQGRLQLVKKDAEIQLRDGRGEILSRGSPEVVMRQQLGWSLPVEVLPAWIQGQPLATIEAVDLTRDDSGRISAFHQLDWHVVLDRYETVGSEPLTRELPTRITAENDQTRLRLVIAEWEI
jgi:outer membrane lipoprotein LolB